MKLKLPLTLAFLLVLLPLNALADRPSLDKIRLQSGAIEGCPSTALDDSAWPEAAFAEIPQQQHFCVRTHINLTAQQASKTQILKLSMLAASRIYWDGILIGENGRVGQSRANEIPGVIDFAVPIPPDLVTSGEHQIAIEASTYHVNERLHSIFYYFIIEDFQGSNTDYLHHIITAVFFMGGLLVAAILFQILYWQYARKAYHQVLSALCVFSALLLVVEKWRALFGYTYDMHILRLHLVVVFTSMTCFLLVTFYLVYYKFRLYWHFAIAAVLLCASLLPVSYDSKSMLLFLIALLSALGINAWGVIRKWAGALANLLGMVIIAFLYCMAPLTFLEDRFALASFIVVLVTFISIANEMNRSRAQALLSVRMEAELLRRNLQPHFLMNSLMLAIEWIEQKPKAASGFVQALADELGMLVRFSEKKTISLDEEINLCSKHVNIMAYRYNANYSFEVIGSTAGINLPPAVIHAQIENSFSHNRVPDGTVFKLFVTRTKTNVNLMLHSPLLPKTKSDSAGLGERYIKTRLGDCFGDQYSYASFSQENLWVNIIEFEEQRA